MMWIINAIIISLFFLIQHIQGITLSRLSDTGEIDNIVETNDDYTLYLVSKQDFNQTDAELVLARPDEACPNCLDACQEDTFSDKNIQRFENNFVAFYAPSCTIVSVLQKFENTDALGVVFFFEPKVAFNLYLDYSEDQPIEEFAETAPNDFRNRYVLNPNNLKGELVVQKLTSIWPAVVLEQGFDCKMTPSIQERESGKICTIQSSSNSSIIATIDFRMSPWYSELYSTIPWYIFNGTGVVFFSWIIFHSIRCLFRLRGNIKRYQRGGKTTSLQAGILIVMACTGIVRCSEYTLSLLRDLQIFWVTEIVTQLLWIYGFTLAIIAMYILILYWKQILSSRMGIVHGLSGRSRAHLIVVSLLLFAIVTVAMVFYELKLPFNEYIYITGFSALGALALFLASFFAFYGCRVLLPLVNPESGPTNLQSSRMSTGQNRQSQGLKRTKTMNALSAGIWPMTRLIFGCTTTILLLFSTAIVSAYTDMLRNPTTYFYTVIAVFVLEAISYLLLVATVSPFFIDKRVSRLSRQSARKSSVPQDSRNTKTPRVKLKPPPILEDTIQLPKL